MDRTSNQKINDTESLNNTINHQDLKDICRIFQQKKNTHSSQRHIKYSPEHNKCKKIELIKNIFEQSWPVLLSWFECCPIH